MGFLGELNVDIQIHFLQCTQEVNNAQASRNLCMFRRVPLDGHVQAAEASGVD